MAEDSNTAGKTVRISLESLVINVTNDELKYRNKYLPDPRRLSDDKILCTVCSVPLASRVRKGKDIYIHGILGVLMCKNCHSFYGDGVFSTDEDGEDKYCRWCGQGGTLYLCSKCNCGFCKKCMMKNMKNSALAEIEKDNWKCLICIPRPIFGSRAVCWASRELNNTVRKSVLLRLRLEEEKLRLEGENGLSELEETDNSSVKRRNTTKKRDRDSEDSDSSSVFIPAKKLKGDAKTKKSLNGSVKKHRRKDSLESESSNDDRSSKLEGRKRKKLNKRQSLSSEESSTSKRNRKKKNRKEKIKSSSNESSDNGDSVPKSKKSQSNQKMSKTKRKKKMSNRKKESSSDLSSSESTEKPRKTKKTHSKIMSLSASASEDDERKSNNIEKQQILHINDDIRVPDFCGEDHADSGDANDEEINSDGVKPESVVSFISKTNEIELENETSQFKGNQSFEKSEFVNEAETLLPVQKHNTKSGVFANESETLQNNDQPNHSEESPSSQQISLVIEDDFTLLYRESSSSSDERLYLSQEEEVKVKVHLAIEWLDVVSRDIADLGSLIAERANKFGERKVNLENLHSYEDVFSTLGKMKQLLGGIHTNYKQIEDSLEDKLKSWKILAGLENSDLEEQLYVNEENEKQDEGEESAGDVITTEGNIETQVDENKLQGDDPSVEPNKDEKELVSKVDSSVFQGENSALNANLEKELTNDCIKYEILDNDEKDCFTKEAEKNEKLEEAESIFSQNEKMIEEGDDEIETTLMQDLDSERIDNAMIKAELNLKRSSSNLVWSGLLSSDDDLDLNSEISTKPYFNCDNGKLTVEDNQESELCDDNEKDCESLAENKRTDEEKEMLGMANEESDRKERESDKLDAENFEALQELLYSSTEPEIDSSESDSDDSDDFQLDDSDLEDILKPRKVVIKKSSKAKEQKFKEESSKNLEDKIDNKNEDEDINEEKPQNLEAEKKPEEQLDSEAEIDMLTDLSKLKKKTLFRRVEQENSSSAESSSEDSEDDGNEDHIGNKKRRKKYNNEIKKKREQERNELFGFLQGDSSAEDDVDITKDDLDVMEDQYVSNSSDSMSLETFSRKMNEKWKELEKEQDQLNLQMLLASESEQGSVGGDDIVLDSDEDKKKKTGKKIKEEKINEDDAGAESDKNKETEVKVKEEKEGGEKPDEEYEQFLEGIAKTRTTFTGLGSSSEEDKEKEEMEIKEEPLSDHETKVKKESKDSNDESSSNSDSSSDLFLDIRKKKSEKKTVWRQHKLLRLKLSDTDTSDEERWWQRRLEREKKKKEQGDSDSSEFDEFTQAISSKKSESHEKKKKEDNGSDKENKRIKKEKHKEDEETNSSSTLEMSSTDSSGSEIFKKKKKKKKGSSDSDVIILSDMEKKKKKKKKRMNLSGDSSDESDGSDSNVIDITQKNSQGESPGKGGRKNIRKVLTKHELAAATKAAAKEEEERKKRIAARQKLFNEMFEIKEAEVLEKLVLDFDPETKTELISVDKDLVTKMKPHQAKGVKFMWDSCFESLSQLKTKKGSGCILAHCMGLGKTFQVVSLVHTILTHKDTNVSTVLVVCPLSTVLNWYNEFDKWLEDVSGGRNIKIYHLTKYKKAHERSKQLSLWHRTGGVMVLGYEMFRILANPNSKKFRLMHTEVFQKTLIDPGADLVVCDEGHMLKNESTLLSKAMSRIRTLRRIVLTGTPMQNNLKEYHCMVQFVKPNLLGTRKEFLNQFVNPITNGQFVDSTEADVKVMKRRAHVLHKMLEGLVQRFDYSVLTPFLPPKHEYVISLRLSDVQVKLYQFYMDYFCQKNSDDKRTSSQLFQDWQVLGRVWTHPRVLKLSTEKAEKEKQDSSESEVEQKKLRSQRSIKDFFKKKRSSSSDSSKQESEDEGSLKDFNNDKSSSSSLSLSSSSDDENGEKKEKREKKKKEKVKKDSKELEKKEAPSIVVLAAEPVDEINLISSEEEDVNNKEEVKEIKKAEADESENKANDSGIEDQEGKTSDEPNAAEETMKPNTDDKDEKESKEDEKEENKEEASEKEKKKIETEQLDRRGAWWKEIIEPAHLEDINQSAKLVILFAILRECEMIEDKVLVFSQSLFSLDLIEYFLQKVDRATEENRLDESLGNHAGCWQKGLDYFRLDGSSSSESRSAWCKSFNREDNSRARLFLISTRAGGLGINLTGANRVVIFDASWNPSHDIQSIFRIYRFGQKKPCYVYRFVAHGTMEEKVYDRQVAKQLLSSRVVDEQQVQRHFSMNDLNELYTFTPPQERTEKPIPVLPKDRLMAELLTQYNDLIEKYHEHDSLLENIAEEELNEEERKLAWEDYENEKKTGFLPPAPGTGISNFSTAANQIELFRKSLRLKFPNATDAEMNAMLQTLMYQVNYRTISQQVGVQQQPGQQGNAGPSQQQQNFRAMNSSNIAQASSQAFTQMVQKMNQSFQKPYVSQPMQQQRIGTNQMNQQRMGSGSMNQQMVGNGEIRKTNKTNQEIYLEEMRKQQAANLARIQNQRRYQQQFEPTNPGQQQIQQMNTVRQPRVDRGMKRGPTKIQVPPQQLTSQGRPTQGQNMWKSTQPLPVTSRVQNMQKQRQNAVNILSSRKQVQVTPIRNNAQPVARNPQQTPWKTPQQKQEEMRQRIKQMQMQQQKNQQTLQQNMQQGMQKGSSLDPAQQRRLEEMKKRYNASRMKQSSVSTPISIVEIDDEPGT